MQRHVVNDCGLRGAPDLLFSVVHLGAKSVTALQLFRRVTFPNVRETLDRGEHRC